MFFATCLILHHPFYFFDLNKQALRNSCELLRRRWQLHTRSWNYLRTYHPEVIPKSSWNIPEVFLTEVFLKSSWSLPEVFLKSSMKLHAFWNSPEHSRTFWNCPDCILWKNFRLELGQMDGQTEDRTCWAASLQLRMLWTRMHTVLGFYKKDLFLNPDLGF